MTDIRITPAQRDTTPLEGRKGISVAQKVALLFVLLTSLTLAALWVGTYFNLSSLLKSQTDSLGNAIATQSARSAAELLLADDLLSLNLIASKLEEDENIDFALFFNSKGEVLAASPKTPADKRKLATFKNRIKHDQSNYYVEPIIFQNLIVGYAQVSLNSDTISQTFENTRLGMTIATLSALIFAIILAIFVGRNITKPLKQLIEATDRIANGDFEARIPERKKDEIGVLIHHFNSMASGLKEREQIKSTFSQYVSPNIANNILANLEQPRVPSKYVNASVLFVDIAGFTSMCEQMSPQQVEHLLNDYYELILKASRLYNGTVDKYIGDGAMILFGAPEDDPEHSFHAVCCALLLLRLVEQLNNERSRYNSPVIQFKLGIHCGEMLAGAIGSKGHLQYTVVGNAVNVASRLCNAANAGELIISDSVHNEVSNGDPQHADEKIKLETPRLLSLKGKSHPVQTFVVKAVSAKYQSLIDKQAKALRKSAPELEPNH